MEFLRDPALSGIGAIVTIIALLVYLYAEREKIFTRHSRRIIYLFLIGVHWGISTGVVSIVLPQVWPSLSLLLDNIAIADYMLVVLKLLLVAVIAILAILLLFGLTAWWIIKSLSAPVRDDLTDISKEKLSRTLQVMGYFIGLFGSRWAASILLAVNMEAAFQANGGG